MPESTNKFSKEIAPPQPATLNRKRRPTPPISMITFFSLLSFIFCLVFCQRSTETLSNNNGPDTTSHNFTWVIDTIGDKNSYLYDVAVINENDIWAVGEINIDGEEDSYNAVHWNGDEWELHHIPAITYTGSITKGSIYSVFAFASDELWMFSAAGSYAYWNGTVWMSEFISERKGGVRKIWGRSSNDMYFVGTNGNISHFDGSAWQLLESGTETDINDIWGCVDLESGKKTVLCAVSNRWHQGDVRLLSINGSSVNDALNWDPHKGLLMSIWFNDKSLVYAAGKGLYNWRDSSWVKILEIPDYRTLRVRGSSSNNVFVVGVFGLTMHFNGSSWKRYFELEMDQGELRGLVVKNNYIVSVGNNGNKGIIMRGIKN